MGPDEMWAEYSTATGVSGSWSADAFGVPGTELADELAHLVLRGRKRATAGLLAEYEAEDEPLPEPGDHTVVLDAGGEAVCVIRVSEVELRPFGEVDGSFARDEGEGDRTLGWWRRAHREFFAGLGWAVDDESTMVLIRFERVWPTGNS